MDNKLCNENYFSLENNMKYAGSSQIKSFLKCEAETMAELNAEWKPEKNKAMLVSSYIDEAISDTLDIFKAQNPDIFKKDGTLKSEYIIAEEVLNQIENDEMFYKYLQGEHQVIMTGEISGVPIKIKIDSYFPHKAIIDLKAMKDFNLIWNEQEKRKLNFIEHYDYILQGALYQEIVRQNTGETLPFIIAACTKEKYSERALLAIPQEELNNKLDFIKQYLPHIQELKENKIKPTCCNKCDYCKSRMKTQKIYDYTYYFQNRNI